MLTFFRRIIFNPIGGVIALAIVALMGLAFAIGDAGGLSKSGFGGQGATTAATVGNQDLTTTDVTNSTNGLLDMYRRQSPQLANLSMEEFITKGGFDGPLESRLSGMAMAQFADSMGMRVGKPLIDNEIGQIPGIRGLDGKVDAQRYNEFLALLKMTDAQMHDQMGRDIATRLLLGPLNADALKKLKGSPLMATPYASMLLEKRTGTVAFVDTKKMPAGAAPTDAEAQAYYKTNIARYVVPERRSARYALFSIEEIKKRATPTDDQIAAAYKASGTRFATSETRSLKQVVLLDQKSATDLAAKVRAGTTIDLAAKAAGLDAAAVNDVAKPAYATQTSGPLADQVFAAASGATIGPVKTAIGWTVAHVEKITPIAAKTLDQAKPELLKELTDKNEAMLGQTVRDQVEEALAEHQTLDQIAATLKLTISAAPALTADGRDPDATTPVLPDPNLASVYELAFQSAIDDDPQLVAIGKDGSIALAKIDKIIPAAPRPYAAIADQVKKDITTDRQIKAARDVANVILGKVNKGMPLSKAMAESGIALDATKPMAANRAQLFAAKQAPPPLILLFSKPRGTAALLQAPYKGGWFVIVVDSVTPGNATGNAELIEKMRGDLGGAMGEEYRQQFVRAVREKVGIKKNDAAIKSVRDQLLGKGGDQPQ